MAEISSITTVIRGFIKDQARTDGRDAFEFDTDSKFTLSEDFPIESSMQVFKNGSLLPTGDWSYNSNTNQITIDIVTSGDSLDQDDTILITYDYYGKYSDTEIAGYIRSSLAWFTVFRYKKLFQINEDGDEVISKNDVNPTDSEQQLIAIISSIEIDPNNTNIRTPDFTLTGVENKSKKDQIKEVFMKWLKFTGEIEFIEDEDC